MRNIDSNRKRAALIAAFLLVLGFVPIQAQSPVPNSRKDRARVLLSTPPHTHPCAVVGYVVEGSLRMRVEGQPEKLYSVGESFYEAPNGVHAVSANASATQPAKLIAYFVCDHDAPLSVNVSTSQTGGN